MYKDISKRSVFLLVAHSLAIGSNALANLILAAVLEPKTYGSVFFFLTALNFILIASMLGFQHVIMHQAPRMEERNDNDSINRLIHGSWSVCGTLGFFLALLFALWHWFILPLNMPGAGGAVLCLLLIAPLWSLIRVMLPFLLSRGAAFSGVLTDQGLQALGLVLMLPLGFIFTQHSENPAFYLSGQIAAGLAGVFISLHFTKKYFSHLKPFRFSFLEPIEEWKALNLPFFGFSVLQQLLQRLDLLLIGFLAGPVPLASYAIAMKLSQLLNFPAMASKAAISPRFSNLYEKGDISSLLKLLLMSTLGLTAIGIIMGAFIYVAAEPLLGLLGNNYLESALYILFFLLLAEIIICIFTPLKLCLLMGESQMLLNILYGFGSLISLAANLYVIPLYGIEAAAYVRLSVILLVNVSMIIGLREVLRQRHLP